MTKNIEPILYVSLTTSVTLCVVDTPDSLIKFKWETIGKSIFICLVGDLFISSRLSSLVN